MKKKKKSDNIAVNDAKILKSFKNLKKWTNASQ